MTIAVFTGFMSALSREIERTKKPCCSTCLRPLANGETHDPCDDIPIIKNGVVDGWCPNYDKPGVTERVARDAYDAEATANPPRSSVGLLLQMADRVRFEKSIQGEK